MNPVAIDLFGIEIAWYGIIIALGTLGAILFAYFILKKEKNFNENYFLNAIIITVVFGFIGARAYFVLFNLADVHSFWDVINTRGGGLAFHGGVILGLIAFIIYTQRKKIDTLRYLDVISVGVLFAQGVGRWGNFINQEAHGGPVTQEFISRFPAFIQEGMLINGIYYHPTFLYESLNDLLWFVILAFLVIRKVNFKKGTFLALAIFGNSLGRFFIEGLRTDSLMLGPLRIAQVVALTGMALSLLYLIYLYLIRDRNKKVIDKGERVDKK